MLPTWCSQATCSNLSDRPPKMNGRQTLRDSRRNDELIMGSRTQWRATWYVRHSWTEVSDVGRCNACSLYTNRQHLNCIRSRMRNQCSLSSSRGVMFSFFLRPYISRAALFKMAWTRSNWQAGKCDMGLFQWSTFDTKKLLTSCTADEIGIDFRMARIRRIC